MNLFYELIRDDAGKKIKYERKAWGMSRKRLASLAYTDPETIESIEKGYVCMMDFKLLVNIARALDISPFIFFRKVLTNEEIVDYMKHPVVFDFKGVLNPYTLKDVEYYAIGKRTKKKKED